MAVRCSRSGISNPEDADPLAVPEPEPEPPKENIAPRGRARSPRQLAGCLLRPHVVVKSVRLNSVCCRRWRCREQREGDATMSAAVHGLLHALPIEII